MLDILLFVFVGLIIGIVFGLVPGLHPNMIVLMVPLIAQLNLYPLQTIAFIVSVGVSNTFLDLIPSMLFGAADAGKELSVLPSHRMMLDGNGYEAVKLAVLGGVGSLVLVAALLPMLIISIPAVYEFIRPLTYAILIFIVGTMILYEKGSKLRGLSLLCFFLAGVIGISSQRLPVDPIILLFPILSGMFGVSILLFSPNYRIKITSKKKEVRLSSRLQRRGVVFGTLGGISSGMMPGIGSSEIASLASVDKNEKSFLVTIGAITLSNTLLSIIALWLIGRTRSGLAVALDQLAFVGFNETVFITGVALFVGGISAVITLFITKRTLKLMSKINYGSVCKFIIAVIVAMTFIFSGVYGLLILVTCTALGIFANMCGVRRSILMGVLILPTIIFYLPF